MGELDDDQTYCLTCRKPFVPAADDPGDGYCSMECWEKPMTMDSENMVQPANAEVD